MLTLEREFESQVLALPDFVKIFCNRDQSNRPYARLGNGTLVALDGAGGSVLNARGDLLTRDATQEIALSLGAANTILGSNGTDPAWTTISAILDSLSSAHGSILYRSGGAWVALTPGTAGQLLQTNGAGVDPSWVTPAASVVKTQFEEEFVSSNTDQDEMAKYGWRNTTQGGGGNSILFVQQQGRLGIIRIAPGTTAVNGRRAIHVGEPGVNSYVFTEDGSLGLNTFTMLWEVRLEGTLSDGDIEMIQFGMGEASEMGNNGAISQGIFVRFDPSVSNTFRLVLAEGADTVEDGTTNVALDQWYTVGFRYTDTNPGYSVQLLVSPSAGPNPQYSAANEGSPIVGSGQSVGPVCPFAKIDGTGGGGINPLFFIDNAAIIIGQ